MMSVALILALAILILALVSAAGKVPLWVPVVLIGVDLLVMAIGVH